MIDVEANRARFGEAELAVAKRRDLAQRVNRVDLGRMRHYRHEDVGHTLFVAGDAGDPDVIALRRADNLEFWHGCAPSGGSLDTDVAVEQRYDAREERNRHADVFSRKRL